MCGAYHLSGEYTVGASESSISTGGLRIGLTVTGAGTPYCDSCATLVNLIYDCSFECGGESPVLVCTGSIFTLVHFLAINIIMHTQAMQQQQQHKPPHPSQGHHVLVIIDSREMTASRKNDAQDLVTLWKKAATATTIAAATVQVVLFPLDIGDVWFCESAQPFSVPSHVTTLVAAYPSAPCDDPSTFFNLFEPRPPSPLSAHPAVEPNVVVFPPKPRIVIERKALADLQSSYGDGRYHDQKARLTNCNADQVVLLVEGYAGSKIKDPTLKRRFLSTFTHCMFRDNMAVYHTRDIQESFEWLQHIATEMARGALTRTVEYMERTKYTDNIQMNRKHNLGADRGLELQLASIPGVSAKMARAVAEKYPTMMALCKAYEPLSSRDANKLLEDIMYRGPSGKDRRLASQSAKIYSYVSGTVNAAPSKNKKPKVVE